MERERKVACLKELLARYPSAAVAFSGGVDSSLLACLTHDVLGEKSVAITVDSIFIPRREIDLARQTAAQIGIKHLLIPISDFPKEILANDRERCYHCKRIIFNTIREIADREGVEVLFDGSNVDDLADYRPGMRALQELGVRSPLLECGMSKEDIRQLSRELGLPTWDHPALACLASRVEYGQTIDKDVLHRIEQAEEVLRDLGFQQVRVRLHHDLARIEVAPEEREKFFTVDILDAVNRKLKDLGFRYVSLDLEGYVTGKLNRK